MFSTTKNCTGGWIGHWRTKTPSGTSWFFMSINTINHWNSSRKSFHSIMLLLKNDPYGLVGDASKTPIHSISLQSPLILLCQLLFQRFFYALSDLVQRAILIVLLAFLFLSPLKLCREWIVNISSIKRWNIDIRFSFSIVSFGRLVRGSRGDLEYTWLLSELLFSHFSHEILIKGAW